MTAKRSTYSLLSNSCSGSEFAGGGRVEQPKNFPFFGWINCEGNCSGSKGPSSTAFSAGALSALVTIKMTSAELLATGAVVVMRVGEELANPI